MEVQLRKTAETTFLALALWREARGESLDAKRGVACCILNRVKKPCWWGTDILSVLFKKWQFSSLTAPGDKQLTTYPTADDTQFEICMQIARDAVNGSIMNPVPGADSYYDVSISAPVWATSKTFVRQIGRIIFHNTDHDIEK